MPAPTEPDVTGEYAKAAAPDLSTYRVLIADWALPPDAIALEHFPLGWDTPPYCLVWSSTLPWRLDAVTRAITAHDAKCTHVR